MKAEIKEETEEEKIDAENHFHPVISSYLAVWAENSQEIPKSVWLEL